MKKLIWIVVGIVVVAGVVFVSRDKAQISEDGTAEHTEYTEKDALQERIASGMGGSVSEVVSNGQVGADERVPLPSVVRPLADRSAISVELATLFGWGDAGMYQQRNRMLDDLGRDLSVTEVDALMAFLYMQPHEVGLSESDFNATGDKVMETIENQLSLDPDYTDHLAVIFYDQSYNEVWRDYCLQHIGSCYTRMKKEKLPVLRQLFEDALEPGMNMAGTAVLAMKNALGGEKITPGYVFERAVKVASESQYPDSSRLSAMLVAAEMAEQEGLGLEVLSLARSVVESNENTAHFRTSALATIGMAGSRKDLPLLTRYSQSSDIRLRTAATAAMKRIVAKY